MRNQQLTGYVLHQKPYQDNRSLTYFFSQEFGLVHGIGKKNLPLFSPISLFASGKQGLKNFSQSQLTNHHLQLAGQGLFAGLYLNEILLKLLPVEEAYLDVWQAYAYCLSQIFTLFGSENHFDSLQQLTFLKYYLRQFESKLLENIGYGIDFEHDSVGFEIVADQSYQYQLQQGFISIVDHSKTERHTIITGTAIQQWRNLLGEPTLFVQNYIEDTNQTISHINQFSHIYKKIIDELVNYETLQSRELWRQLAQLHQ